jgi:adenosylmethionine-8-amino-7-oxononanoate aminotransferase
MLAGFTHEPAIRAGRSAGAPGPAGPDRCFYADNGSAAVEVALKMSFHYWRNWARAPSAFRDARQLSYHGETLGALAVGNVDLYKSTYAPLLMDVLTVPSPDCYGANPG